MTGRFAVLLLLASVLPAAAQDAASLDALVDAERLTLKNDCKALELGRDLGHAVKAGWRVASVQGFDLFPMTHHLEAVALLLPPSR